MTKNLEKLRYHANAAERCQVEIEEIERIAESVGGASQYGRMERSNKTVIPDSYMAKSLLQHNHRYLQLVGTRNGHQAQVAMYAALVMAGVEETGYVRHSLDGKSFELKPRQ